MKAIKLLVLVLIVHSFSSCNAQEDNRSRKAAEDYPLMGDLKPGKYDVGFKVIEKYDYTRPVKLKHDYKGNFQSGVRWRPLQISIWYPAKGTGSARVLLQDYYSLTLTETNFDRVLSKNDIQKELRKKFSAKLKSYHLAKADSAGREKILNIKTSAVKNAPAAEGSFPLIIVTQNNGDSPFNQSLIAEYLTSHGFIVASTISATIISPQGDFVENEAKDIEFVINQMYEFPNVDKDKLALYTVGLGGMSGGKVLFRNTEVDAFISVESGFATPQGVQGIKTAPEYAFAKNRSVPLMHMYRVRKDPADFTIMNSYKYSDKYMIEMKELRHFNFSTIGMVASLYPDYVSDAQWILGGDKAKTGHKVVGEYVLNFLNKYLRNNKDALDFLDNAIKKDYYSNEISNYKAVNAIEPGVPSESEFAKIMMAKGIDEALGIYNEAKKKNPEVVLFSENTLIGVGYFGFLNKGKIKEAIKIFQLVTDAFPDSWNGFDSLAEAFMVDKQNSLAVKYYKKSLEINPENTNAKQKLTELGAN